MLALIRELSRHEPVLDAVQPLAVKRFVLGSLPDSADGGTSAGGGAKFAVIGG